MLPGGAPETSPKEWRYNLLLKAFKPPQQLNLRKMQGKEKKGISTVFVFAVFLVAACMPYIPPPNFFYYRFIRNFALRCTRNEL